MKENIVIDSWTQDYYDENSTDDVFGRVVEQTQSLNDLLEIAGHKNVSAKTLDRIVELSEVTSFDRYCYGIRDIDILMKVIWNKNVSLETLEKIVNKTDDKDILLAISMNDNASGKIKYKALKKINKNPEYEFYRFAFIVLIIVFGLKNIVEVSNFISNNFIQIGISCLLCFGYCVYLYKDEDKEK